MKPTKHLPETYHAVGTLDLGKDRKALILLNFLGLILFFFFSWLFTQYLYWVRPAEYTAGLSLTFDSTADYLRVIGVFVLVMVLMIVLHEGLHGIFFWLYTRSRPKFAFRGAYAYAAAPGWYIPRNQYLVTSLAPLVGISVLGAVLLTFVPAGWFMPVLILMIMNASGAVGDLVVAGWLLQQPDTCFGFDQGDAVTLFVLDE